MIYLDARTQDVVLMRNELIGLICEDIQQAIPDLTGASLVDLAETICRTVEDYCSEDRIRLLVGEFMGRNIQ